MDTQVADTQQPEYSADGMDGYYKGCTIHIDRLETGDYNVQVDKKFWHLGGVHFGSAEACRTWAEFKCEYIHQTENKP